MVLTCEIRVGILQGPGQVMNFAAKDAARDRRV